MRNIIQNYFLTNNYNGSLPYIVGPFTSQEIEKFQKMTASDLEPDSTTISKIKSQLTTGKNISSLYIDNFKELSKKAKELLTKNAKNSLLNNDVKKWYRIESV